MNLGGNGSGTTSRHSLVGRLLMLFVLMSVLASSLTLTACDRIPGFEDEDATATAEAEAEGTPEARPTANRRVVRSVAADGQLILPMEPLPLGFSAGGTLEEVMVEVGESVFQGRPLAMIDTDQLEMAVADARAAVVSAQNSLDKLGDGGSLETGRLQVEQAKNQLWGAQAQRDATCGGYELGQKEGGAAKAMAPSAAQCDGAQANVQALEQGVQLAQENLRMIEANQPGDTTVAQVQLQTARMALAQAQENVARAILTSPVTGTITAVHLLPGLQASPGAPVVTVDPEGWLEFVTTNLGERYVGDIEEGAQAEITLTAYPDSPIEGTVIRVGRRGAADPSGAVVFSVYIELGPTDLPLYAGMSGRAEIEVTEDADEAARLDDEASDGDENSDSDDGDDSGNEDEDGKGEKDNKGEEDDDTEPF